MQDLTLGPTREILWNAPHVFHVFFVKLFDFLGLGIAAVLFAIWGATIVYGVWRWVPIVRQGKPENRLDRIPLRLQRVLFEAIGQNRVVREPAGVMHMLLYVSFLTLFIGTNIVLVEGDTPLEFYYGAFYAFYKLIMDVAGVCLIGTSTYFLWRRWSAKPRALENPAADKMNDNMENAAGYGYPLVMLWLIGFTGLLLEAARIVANPQSSAGLAFAGAAMASGLRAAGAGVGTHYAIWWIHIVIVLGFLYTMTYTKMRHVFLAPVNIFFGKLDNGLRLTPISEEQFNSAETFGVAQVEEYTWKQMLDMAACLECGRCTLNCPTVNTDKALNPKHLVMAQREHLLQKTPFLQAQLAKFAAGTSDRAEAEAEAWSGPDMITEVATENVIWGCTTCGWCEEGCPVAIEHIQRIVDMRRHQVLVQSSFPTDLAKSFKSTENQSNPWGLPSDQRGTWAEGLEVPMMAEIGEDERVEVLYWVGCAGSFDERNQKTSKALVKIMKAANVKFGILGMEEGCTGEPARRLGNEYLYFTLASMNVETLKRYKFDKIVTQCPHCFNTIKNEYPDLGGQFQVVHTTQFIESLLAAGRLKLEKGFLDKRLTIHDPCYLARHNDIHEAPRKILDQVKGAKRVDVEQSGRRTFCCGAGGGQFWKEEEHGTKRINQTRFDQLMEAKPDVVAVACPFCTTMISDAAKAKGVEDTVAVKDMVEIVAESLG